MSEQGGNGILGQRRSSEVDESSVIAVPVGSLEQHGPNLPLDTDTRIATAVAQAVPGGLLAPAIAYGASGDHDGIAGTISIGNAALETFIVEYGRSACQWARRVVFVNGHVGNESAVRAAVMLLRHEGRDVVWFSCTIPRPNEHGGRSETSIMLYLDARAVLGQPSKASATVGEDMLEAIRGRFRAAVASWTPSSGGNVA